MRAPRAYVSKPEKCGQVTGFIFPGSRLYTRQYDPKVVERKAPHRSLIFAGSLTEIYMYTLWCMLRRLVSTIIDACVASRSLSLDSHRAAAIDILAKDENVQKQYDYFMRLFLSSLSFKTIFLCLLFIRRLYSTADVTTIIMKFAECPSTVRGEAFGRSVTLLNGRDARGDNEGWRELHCIIYELFCENSLLVLCFSQTVRRII